MKRAPHSSAIDRLVGRWETDDRDSSAVFEVAVVAGKPVVAGFDNDGERFKVSDVEWDGKNLSFVALMPSTLPFTAQVYAREGRPGPDPFPGRRALSCTISVRSDPSPADSVLRPAIDFYTLRRVSPRAAQAFGFIPLRYGEDRRALLDRDICG